MRYDVSGQHIDIGDSLSGYVKDSLGTNLEKYAERPTSAKITFSKNRHIFVCETSVHLSTGLEVNATGKADDIYSAFDKCNTRTEKQLRRYKRKLKDHHAGRATPVETYTEADYKAAHHDDSQDQEPLIIAEKNEEFDRLSVGSAAMKMDLAGHGFLLFKNDKTGRVNVVHHRDDGNVGWIDIDQA